MHRRTAVGCFTTSNPATRAVPRRVRSASTGCGRASSCPRRSVRAARRRHLRAPTRSTPHSACVSPNERAMPSTSTIAFMCLPSPRARRACVRRGSLPERHAVQTFRLDVAGQLFGERAVGVDERALVVHLDEEQRGARRCPSRPPTMASSSDSRSCNAPTRWSSRWTTRSGGSTPISESPASNCGNSLAERAEQLRHPLVDLGAAVVGDAVDGALGSPTFPHHLLLLDQPPLEQGLDHAVERAVVEADAGVLAPRPHGGGHLVGVHRALGETGQHGEGEWVASGDGPCATSLLGRILGAEYTDRDIAQPLPARIPPPVDVAGVAPTDTHRCGT